MAAANGKFEIIKLLLMNNMKVDAQDLVDI